MLNLFTNSAGILINVNCKLRLFLSGCAQIFCIRIYNTVDLFMPFTGLQPYKYPYTYIFYLFTCVLIFL